MMKPTPEQEALIAENVASFEAFMRNQATGGKPGVEPDAQDAVTIRIGAELLRAIMLVGMQEGDPKGDGLPTPANLLIEGFCRSLGWAIVDIAERVYNSGPVIGMGFDAFVSAMAHGVRDRAMAICEDKPMVEKSVRTGEDAKDDQRMSFLLGAKPAGSA